MLIQAKETFFPNPSIAEFSNVIPFYFLSITILLGSYLLFNAWYNGIILTCAKKFLLALSAST